MLFLLSNNYPFRDELSYFINKIVVLKLSSYFFQFVGNTGIYQFISCLQYKATYDLWVDHGFQLDGFHIAGFLYLRYNGILNIFTYRYSSCQLNCMNFLFMLVLLNKRGNDLW